MQRQTRSVFIVGTDTEVGKTFQAELLVRHLAAQGLTIGVYKPVASGHRQDADSDAGRLLAATGKDWPMDRVCPQRFAAELAPPVAARLENRDVDEPLLHSGICWWYEQCELLIVEGAGGALSPISETMTCLDLAGLADLRLILVAANRLGVVNHVLLSVEAIRSRQLPLLGVVLNDIPPNAAQDDSPNVDQSCGSNQQLLTGFLKDVPIVPSIVDLAPLL